MMRSPMSEEQKRIRAAAYIAHPNGIVPADSAGREVCESLVRRGDLNALGIGYLASDELIGAMALQAQAN